MAVNLSDQEQTVLLPAKAGEVFKVLHDARTLTAGADGLPDKMGSYQTRVYLTDPVPELKLTAILKTYKETDSCIGISGPENLAHFWDGAKIKTSSCLSLRVSAAAIDGAYTSGWIADPDDKHPSIEISFHHPSAVARMIVVGSERPAACAVLTGSQWTDVPLSALRAFHISWNDEANIWEETPSALKRYTEYPAWEYTLSISQTEAVRITGLRQAQEIQFFKK